MHAINYTAREDAINGVLSGEIDTWATYSPLSLDLYDNWLYSTPFGKERYGALLRKQQTHIFEINHAALMAGIHFTMYMTIFAFVLCLTLISFLNEQREHKCDRNTSWHVAHSLMPSNMIEWKHQDGITRKILILNCAFTVLLSTTYYQSNLLQTLLLQKMPSKITVEEMTDNIRNHRSDLYTYYALFEIIKDSNMTDLISALLANPPDLEASDNPDNYELINSSRTIIFENIMSINQRLSKLAPSSCGDFSVIELTELVPSWMSLVLSKRRRDSLDSLNVIVAERMDYITNLMDGTQLKDECREHIYPSNDQEMKFVPLNVYALSGAFALIVCLSLLALVVLIGEILFGKYTHKEGATPSIGLNIADELDVVFGEQFLHRIHSDKIDNVLVAYYAFRDQMILSVHT